MPLPPGTRLGPYVLRSLLGSGGMGEVYQAEDARLHRTVAIKVLPREIATPDRIERFEQEARAASALNHPNILTIHDVGRDGETAYLAMEWVDGRTLRQMLRDGPIPLRQTIRLAQQIAEGLAKAHAAGIVHRDLKPENVMVTGGGLAKIVDFGLAKLAARIKTAVDDQAPTVTRVGATDPGMVMGTAGYMSPEQASGCPVDYRSDQFALGLLIYELATRTRPFVRATTAQTLAVRPFRSLSDAAQPAYFAAGMTEEIRGQLSQVSALRLLSRNALDGYRDDEARAIRELGIQHIVDGSIRVEGSRVRVSAELVDASTQQTLWSNNFDRDLADVLAVQSEIARQIARALTLNLSPSEQQRIEKRPTGNLEAYSFYLQAQQASPFERARNVEAIELLRKAVALDPKFAAAQARIGFRLIVMGYYDDASYVDKGIVEAQAALRLDPSLPFVHFALGTGYGMKGLDAQARQAFLRALELDPNSTGAMANLSIQELTHGRLDEAAYWGRRGFLLSGKRGNDFYHLVVPLLNLRADRETRILLEEGERRAPGFSRVQMMLAALELFEGHADRALSRADALVAAQPQDEEVKFFRADMAFLLDSADLETWVTPLLAHGAANNLWVAETVRMRHAYALARRGEASKAAELVDEAERIARQKIEAGNEIPALRVEMAAAAAMRRQTSGALEWLERAVDAGYRDYDFIARDPILAPLRNQPRFAAAVDRMRRAVDADRARAVERGLLDVAPLLSSNPTR